MQRTRKTTINASASVARFLTQLAVQFLVRTVFIHFLAKEYLGLDSLFADVIQILNVAELGIGVAMGFCMYKPVAEGDIEKIKSFDALFKKIFLVLSGTVLVLGILMIPLFPLLVRGESPAGINIYVVYAMFLTDTVVSYFAAHKRTLLFVFQQQFVNMLAMTAKYILLGAAQILMLAVVKNYYFYAAALPVATFCECLIILFVAKKLHPEIEGKALPLSRDDKQKLVKNVSALSLHKISGVVIIALDGILITRHFGLNMRAVFSNYQMIVIALTTLITLFLQSVQASVGNMINSTDKEENYCVFSTLNLGYWFLIGTISICFLCLVQPFITIWLGDEWVFGTFAALAIAVRLFVSYLRGGLPNIYKEATGLVGKDWWRAILEPLLNIGLSLVFLKLWGLNGIFIGTIVAAILTCVWTESFVVFHYYFKKNVLFYYLRLMIFCGITTVLGAVAYLACRTLPDGIVFWFLRLVISGGICVVGYCLLYLPTRDFRGLVGFVKQAARSIFNKSQK